MPTYPRLVLFPDRKLRRRAESLPGSAFGTSTLRTYCQVIANLLTSAERAHVLAATQVDLDPAWRVIAVSAENGKSGVSILCNPVVTNEGGGSLDFENSASFACVPCQLSAPSKLTVEYRTPDGKARKVECTRTGARAVFQGVESLNGKIILDRMSAPAALDYTRRYRQELDERLVPEIFLPDEGVVTHLA